MLSGLLVIDKPEGPTSHDVVARARRVLGERRIGHTGTLDPLATGVLPLLLGRATRLAQFLTAEDKRYVAEIRFGVATTTYDRQGDPVGPERTPTGLTYEVVEASLARFRGTFAQAPPPYSAKKVGGVSAHRLARSGQSPTLAPTTVTVHELTLVQVTGVEAQIDLRCSAGFYVRSLAHDLGAVLGCGAHLRSLRRTASGALTLDDAVPLAEVEASPAAARAAVRPLSALLPAWPAVRVTARGADKVRQGAYLAPADCEVPTADSSWLATRAATEPSGSSAVGVRILSPDGELLALGAWVSSPNVESRPEAPPHLSPQESVTRGAVALHPRVVLV